MSFILTTMLLAAPFAPQTDDPDAARRAALMEDKLEFSIYTPKHTDPTSLIRYAKEVAEDDVTFIAIDPLTGNPKMRGRERFFRLGNAVGVQDFAAKRQDAIDVLARLDLMIGEQQAAQATGAPTTGDVTRAIRVDSVDLTVAANLVGGADPGLHVVVLSEPDTLVVRGPESAIASARAILGEMDRPIVGVALRVEFVQAVDSIGDGDTPANQAVKDALAILEPSKSFRNVGRLFLRGRSGPNSDFSVSSQLSPLAEGEDRPEANWLASARGYDPLKQTLELSDMQLRLAVPETIDEMTSRGGKRTKRTVVEELRTDLSLRANETTIVGLMSGASIYVVITYTVDA